MSRPDSPGTDAADFTPQDADEWQRRHARVDPPATDRCVDVDPPADDWEARHAMADRET